MQNVCKIVQGYGTCGFKQFVTTSVDNWFARCYTLCSDSFSPLVAAFLAKLRVDLLAGSCSGSSSEAVNQRRIYLELYASADIFLMR